MGHSHDHTHDHDHHHDHSDHEHHHHEHSHDGHDHSHGHDEGQGMYTKAILTFVLLLIGLGADYLVSNRQQLLFFQGYLRLAYYAIPYLLIGWDVIKHAGRSIVKGDVFNEFFLMSLATIGAFYIGQYPEGVTVMLFYQVGEYFQEAAVSRAKKSIKALLDVRPDSVTVVRNDKTENIHPSLVKIGEVIQVKAGERVALDGELLSVDTTFNTAALTGESKPDHICTGQPVLAGMINISKSAEIKVTTLFKDSKLSRILQLTQEATTRKAKTQLFISRFAKIYTPVVVVLSICITLLPYFFVQQYVFNDWLSRALVFLVISCPCALVISIPLGYFGGIGLASRNGILFKGAHYLDVMTQVDTIVMDKTGTLTKGVFNLQIAEAEGIDKEVWLGYIAALESNSTHPVAKAITNYYKKEITQKVSEVEELAGYGMKGIIEGKQVIAGNLRFMHKQAVSFTPIEKHQSDTVVYTAIDGNYSGYLVIADELKEDAARTVQAFRQSGIRTVMLSGDKQSVVNEVAQTLGIDEAYGDLLPEDKVNKVEALKKENRVIAFAGDGINDAPVIALSDVGIAMGGLGSDVAIETADVVIQNNQPYRIFSAIQIGKLTRNIVWQNIGLAFGVKFIVLMLGAWGIANLWEAVFADVGVALLAILNAVRIQGKKI